MVEQDQYCKRCGAETVPLFQSYVCGAECDIRPGPLYRNMADTPLGDLEVGSVVYYYQCLWEEDEKPARLVSLMGYTWCWDNLDAVHLNAWLYRDPSVPAIIYKGVIRNKKTTESLFGPQTVVMLEQEAVLSLDPE